EEVVGVGLEDNREGNRGGEDRRDDRAGQEEVVGAAPHRGAAGARGRRARGKARSRDSGLRHGRHSKANCSAAAPPCANRGAAAVATPWPPGQEGKACARSGCPAGCWPPSSSPPAP